MEQVMKFVEAKESGKRSAAHLLIPQGADHVGSTYKKQSKPPPGTRSRRLLVLWH